MNECCGSGTLVCALRGLGNGCAPRLETSEIDATAQISTAAILGKRLRVGPGVIIENDVKIGDDCRLGPRVVIHAGDDSRSRGLGEGRGRAWISGVRLLFATRIPALMFLFRSKVDW